MINFSQILDIQTHWMAFRLLEHPPLLSKPLGVFSVLTINLFKVWITVIYIFLKKQKDTYHRRCCCCCWSSRAGRERADVNLICGKSQKIIPRIVIMGKKQIFTLHTCGVEYCAGCKWIVGPSSLWSEEKHLTYMHLIRKWSPGWQAGGRNQLVQLGDCCQLKSPEIALKPSRVSDKHAPRWHRIRFPRSRVRQPAIGPPRPPERRWWSV